MKKFLAAVCAAMLGAGAVQLPLQAAFSVVEDAQTAVEKNMQQFLDMLEKADVDESFTKEDLEDLVFEACDYSNEATTGAGYLVEKFKMIKPTAQSAGYISAQVSIFLDSGEAACEVKKEIPAIGSGQTGGGISVDDGNTPKDNAEPTADEKKSIAAAKNAINAAIWEFEVSNDTTPDDILKMAQDAVGKDSGVTVTLDADNNFTIVKSTSTVNGTVTATLTLTCGNAQDAVAAAKTLPLIVNEQTKAIDEDRHLISVAVDDTIAYSNRVTKEMMLEKARAAVKNGSEVSWKSFHKKNATFQEDGEITGSMVMTLGSETRETYFTEKLPKMTRTLPTDRLSVNKEEWEILRLANIERSKKGLTLLTMIEPLQKACGIRKVELAESFSHTRPNGQKPFTAITGFTYRTAGENIYECDAPAMAVSAVRAMNSWMNSDGHRAAILNENYDYIGTGTYDNKTLGTAVQLFAGVGDLISSISTSSGKTHYIDEDEMQKDYLICTAGDMISCVPLDLEYMTKTDRGYTLKLRAENPVYLTVGDETGTKTEQKSELKFHDVKDTDYFAAAVKWAVARNITAGTSDTTFSPEDTCTRAQILTFLWRAVGSPKSTAANPFNDVSANDYYYDAALWAYEKGMVSGSRFAGSTPCTRASTVEYLWKNAGSPDTAVSGGFSDVADNADYSKAVSWAVQNQVTAGTGETTFSPDMICSRGQIVTFLNRAIQ